MIHTRARPKGEPVSIDHTARRICREMGPTIQFRRLLFPAGLRCLTCSEGCRARETVER